MAHTISKKMYSNELMKYVECEVLVLDEEEGLPDTDRREIVLYCNIGDAPFSENPSVVADEMNDNFPETELIEQYEDFDGRDNLMDVTKDYWD